MAAIAEATVLNSLPVGDGATVTVEPTTVELVVVDVVVRAEVVVVFAVSKGVLGKEDAGE
jgi:hypothetical protein